ncbi:hypothetical protein ACFVVX_07765 [Kitasatospora sp. NPDC058170]|uniref:hypothetical protein n=1 Tax=Kitasatospora sp. NPDC058170 TaxID=3346364 RepID=UPI0036D9D848
MSTPALTAGTGDGAEAGPGPASGTATGTAAASGTGAVAPAHAWRRLARRLGGSSGPGPSGAAGPSALHRAGPHFVIAPAATPHRNGAGPTGLPAGLAAAVEGLQPAPQALILLAAAPDAAAVLLGRLAELTHTAAARGATTLVLAASGLAAAPATGRRPAEQLAELAGITVVAPDGMVTLRPDGTLLTSGPEEGAPSSWWLCPPAGAVRGLGPVWPPSAQAGAPATAAVANTEPVPVPKAVPAAVPAVPAVPAIPAVPVAPAVPAIPAVPAEPAEPAEPAAEVPGPDGLLLSALPNGFWLRSGSAGATRPTSLNQAGAAEGTFVVVVGHPGGPLPPAARLAATVRRLIPSDQGELLLSAPWSTVRALSRLAAELAVALKRDVRVAVGLPMRTAGGYSSRLLDADGNATWEPWLTELTASAELRRLFASAWRDAPTDLTPCGPALFETDVPGWWLEAVPAGLWLRPTDPGIDREPRLLEPDPARPRLLVGAGRQPVPPEVLAGLGRLLDALAQPEAAEPALMVNGVPSSGAVTFGRVVGVPDEPVRPSATATSSSEPAAPVPPAPESAAPVPPAPESAAPEPPAPESALDETAVLEPVILEPVVLAPVVLAPPAVDPLHKQPAEQPDGQPAEPPVEPPAQQPTEPPAEHPVQARPLTSGTAATAPAQPGIAAQRAAFNTLLGSHFQRCASHADQVAMRLPALRSSAREDLKSDLAAVYLHHVDTGIPVTRAELVAAARRSDPGPVASYLACLGSGLRRLPSHHGAVLLGADAGESELRHYVPGALLSEPAPVIGLPAHDVELGTPVEFAVWSVTGRRTSVFAEDGEHEVVFPPGSQFSVLEVMPAEDGRPTRVLLREDGLPATPQRAESGIPDRRDQHARLRLLAWLARRDLLTAEERRTPARPKRFQLTPGVARH